jgi:pimeloyl-ACP methyl ester carboxylesterase
MAAVIRQLDLRDIILVGHSMGCGEVVRYLSKYAGERVSKVVLIATITPMTVKTSDHPEGVDRSSLESGRLKLSKDRPYQIVDAAAAFFNTKENLVSAGILDWWTRMIVDEVSMQTMLVLNEQFTETDFRPDLRTITKPTLLIHGNKDVSTTLDFTSKRTAALIAGSELKVYEGAAHGLPVTHMDRLNADLEAFGTK